MADTNSATHVQVIEETPAYWRAVFDYPPSNIVDASIFEALQLPTNTGLYITDRTRGGWSGLAHVQ